MKIVFDIDATQFRRIQESNEEVRRKVWGLQQLEKKKTGCSPCRHRRDDWCKKLESTVSYETKRCNLFIKSKHT